MGYQGRAIKAHMSAIIVTNYVTLVVVVVVVVAVVVEKYKSLIDQQMKSYYCTLQKKRYIKILLNIGTG